SFVTRIVVLDHGRVVASGSHAQLLADCEIYRRLYRARDAVRSVPSQPAAGGDPAHSPPARAA
ncbi:MAG: hypothetical protein ACKOJF_17545, partial [Planctomycetaceae bacterium]